MPVLYTARLTLTIYDVWAGEDDKHGLRHVEMEPINSVVPDSLWQTTERLRATRLATSLLPHQTPSGEPTSGPAVWYIRLGSNNPDGERIGAIAVCSRSTVVPPDMGWNIRKDLRNKGYATEAAKRVAEYLLNEFQGGFRNAIPVCGLLAIMDFSNPASTQVAKNLGMVDMREVTTDLRIEPFKVYGFALEGRRQFTAKDTLNCFGPGEQGVRVVRMLYDRDTIV